MDLNAARDLVKKLLDSESTLVSISDIDNTDPTQLTIGFESEDGDLFFLTIQEP